MQHTPNVVDAPITNTVEPLDRTEKALGRVAQLRMELGIKAPEPRPTPTIGVVDVDGVDRATAQRCDAPRSIEAPQPTGTGTTSKAPKPDRASSVNRPESAPRYNTDPSDNSGFPKIAHEAKTETQRQHSGKSKKAPAATALEAEVARIKDASLNQAVATAIRKAERTKLKDDSHGGLGLVTTPGSFDDRARWVAEAQNQRAFEFVKWLLHSRWFAHTRGNGWEFTGLLIGQGWMQRVCEMLGCNDMDLKLAADKVQLLAGESVLDVAADRMGEVDLPAHVAVQVRGRFVVEGVVRFLASLAKVNRSTRVYCGHAQMSRLLRENKGSINHAVQTLVRLKLIEVVSKGIPRDPSKPQAARGKASEYRLEWALPASAEGRRFDRLP